MMTSSFDDAVSGIPASQLRGLGVRLKFGKFWTDPREPCGKNRDFRDFCLRHMSKIGLNRTKGTAFSSSLTHGPDQIREIFGPLTLGEYKHLRPQGRLLSHSLMSGRGECAMTRRPPALSNDQRGPHGSQHTIGRTSSAVSCVEFFQIEKNQKIITFSVT